MRKAAVALMQPRSSRVEREIWRREEESLAGRGESCSSSPSPSRRVGPRAAGVMTARWALAGQPEGAGGAAVHNRTDELLRGIRASPDTAVAIGARRCTGPALSGRTEMQAKRLSRCPCSAPASRQCRILRSSGASFEARPSSGWVAPSGLPWCAAVRSIATRRGAVTAELSGSSSFPPATAQGPGLEGARRAGSGGGGVHGVGSAGAASAGAADRRHSLVPSAIAWADGQLSSRNRRLA
jgi:hypothetical protein